MKKLLFIVSMGIIGVWGCLQQEGSTTKKFTGKEEEKKQGKTEMPTVEPPSGKYYAGVKKRRAYYITPIGNAVFVANTDVDIFLEVDFSSGQPLVNIKTSGNLNECEQSPAGAFVKSSFKNSYFANSWSAEWTNAEGQRFEVGIGQHSKYPYPGRLAIDFKVSYYMDTDSGRKRVIHALGAARTLYRPTDSPKKYLKLPDEESAILPKDVKAKFSAGKICPHRGSPD